jgi:hypothetical protein
LIKQLVPKMDQLDLAASENTLATMGRLVDY